MAEKHHDVRERLITILQNAHAGELAAAYAYQAHQRSLWRSGQREQRDEIRRIEEAEWVHRAQVRSHWLLPPARRLFSWDPDRARSTEPDPQRRPTRTR